MATLIFSEKDCCKIVNLTDNRAWHSLSVEETAKALDSSLDRGLSEAVAIVRLGSYGPNTLPETKKRSAWATVTDQFRSLIVGLLLAAAGVAFALGRLAESIAILVVILLNGIIGFATEWKAASALAGLRMRAVAVSRVMRDGSEYQIPDEKLVPGDVVLLTGGDRVPADGRVFQHAALHVDESALTGESLPVAKSADPVSDLKALVGDRYSMVHTGTAVTAGRAHVMVTAIGANTEIGKIGALFEGVPAQETPLEAKLAQLSRALLLIVLALCAAIILVGWLRGFAMLYMVEVGISLAIAAVPEGLLAVTTMTLAVGMQRMAKMNALVRRLPAVETLGSTTVICSDKTGTLTRNEMTVQAFDADAQRIEVTGAGYSAKGEFRVEGRNIDLKHGASDHAALRLALRIGALCNDATLTRLGNKTVVLGDPTEAALIVAAEKAGLDRTELERTFPRIEEIPFSSETRRMVTVHLTAGGSRVAYVKGAPAAVLEACVSVMGFDQATAMSSAARQGVRAANDSLAANGLRILGLACRDLPQHYADGDLTRGLTFVGLVGMADPLREGACETIAVCRRAGIRTIMITGDQLATATEIGRQLGLDRDPQGKPLRSVHARDLIDLDAAGWDAAVVDAAMFARVSPEHKLKIVEALQRQGQVVAMTGDGVNDAPALRMADIGIAMGIRGTEVAKEAADLVITDDNFATIVGAIEEGRIIVHNILRFIHYLFSCNFAEIITVFAAIMVGWPLPLAVMQILWLNFITDIFPAMALALEPSAPDVMKRPPRDPAEPLMTPRFGWLIVWQGMLLAGCSLATFWVGMRWYGVEGAGLRHAVTIAFMTLALTQVFHVFNARSKTRSAFTALLLTNSWLWGATLFCIALQVAAVSVPLLRALLQTVALTIADWSLIALASLAPVAAIEFVKLVKRVTSSGNRGRAATLAFAQR